MKRFLTYLGYATTIVALFFFCYKIYRFRDHLEVALTQWSALLAILLGSCVIALARVLPAIAWHSIINYTSPRPISLIPIYKVYSKTQINKYIPGNVFHFLSRHVAGIKLGLNHRQLFLASAQEIFGLILATIVLGSFASIPYFSKDNDFPLGQTFALAATFFILGSISSSLIFNRFFFKPVKLKPKEAINFFLPQYASYIAFMVINGSVLLLTYVLLGTEYSIRFHLYCVSAYSFAWLSGFLVPGASAGIGVRESILVVLFSSYTAPSSAISAIILMRVISTFADILFFISSYFLDGNSKLKSNHHNDLSPP